MGLPASHWKALPQALIAEPYVARVRFSLICQVKLRLYLQRAASGSTLLAVDSSYHSQMLLPMATLASFISSSKVKASQRGKPTANKQQISSTKLKAAKNAWMSLSSGPPPIGNPHQAHWASHWKPPHLEKSHSHSCWQIPGRSVTVESTEHFEQGMGVDQSKLLECIIDWNANLFVKKQKQKTTCLSTSHKYPISEFSHGI